MKNGFTLLEIIVVMGLITLMSALGLANFRAAARRQAVDTATERLRQAFEQARTNSLSGRKDCVTATCLCNDSNVANDKGLDGWSVVINTATTPNTFVLRASCGGTVFTSNVPERFPSTVNINPAANTVTFVPLGQGVTSGAGVYTLDDVNISYSKTITVTGQGEVQ